MNRKGKKGGKKFQKPIPAQKEGPKNIEFIVMTIHSFIQKQSFFKHLTATIYLNRSKVSLHHQQIALKNG